MITGVEFQNILRSAGISKNDIVHVQSDIRRLGMVEGASDRLSFLQFYHDSIDAVIGENGTLSVYTPFLDFGRYGTPFDVQHSPSQAGVFSEYIMELPDSIRSIHPVNSVTSIGPAAVELTGGAHFHSHGGASPWGRLHAKNAWLVSLGLGFEPGGLSFLHYIENLFGVPYTYVKLLSGEVTDGGQIVTGTFTLSGRYLNYNIAYGTQSFRRNLVETGKAFWSKLGRADILIIRADVLVEEGFKALAKNRYAFLKAEPTFQPGIIPFDGAIANQNKMKPEHAK